MKKNLNRDKLLLKITRIMKKTTILLFICIIHASAIPYAEAQRVSIQIKNGTFYDVVAQIEKQSEFMFFYKSEEVDNNQPITLEATNKLVTEILDEMLKDRGLNYQIIDRQIIISSTRSDSPPAAVRQQGRLINGTVFDDQGEPIIGANIIEKGTANGVISDIDGKFTLTVQENATLQITFIGFISQEIPVRNQTNITVTMREDTQSLDELVVVGYGVQKKVNLTGSVTSINFNEEMINRPITDVSQALSGKASGVWVSQNSGKPGDDGAQLRVRGWGTLNNSNPLVIVDGIESSLSQLNPNDIESISVLKDAASAAIYGSKAANGVILVTTKTGNRNEAVEVDFTSYVGIQTLGRRFELINNSAEAMKISNQAYANDGRGGIFPDYLVKAFEEGSDKYKYPNTDWFGVAYKPAIMSQYNLSIRGGTQRSSSFLSINYMNQDGMISNTESYRYGIRANIDYDVNNWFKIGGRLNYTRQNNAEPYSMSRVYESFYRATSYIAPYDRLGRYGSSEAIDNQGVDLYENFNPLIWAQNGQRLSTIDLMSVNAYFQLNFNRDLFLRATYSSIGRWILVDTYNTPGTGYTDSGRRVVPSGYDREQYEMIRANNISMSNNFYATLNYNKTFAGIHDISVIAGTQAEEYVLKTVRARQSEPPITGLTEVDAGTGGIQAGGNRQNLNMFSYFGRINYTLMQKYLIEANFRADASSRFKQGNRWGYFPGFSVGWRLSEENLIKDLGIFSNLKLRASWGQLGNQNIAGYWPYLDIISQTYPLSYSYGGSFEPGAAVTTLVDQNITWETTTILDVGIDAGFFNNRLTVEADYFYKTTKDIIVQLPIPLILGGLTAPYENVGEMLNKGVEFTINYNNKPASSDRFGYGIGFNFTYVDNKVTKFREDAPDQRFLIREGYSYQTLYGFKTIGIYQSDEEAQTHMHANGFIPKAGHLKFEDVNQDGKMDYEDKQELGNTIPKITYGLSTNFNYKNFDLSLLFQGLMGSHLFTQSGFTNMAFDNNVITVKWRDAWTPENTNTNIPAVRYGSTWDILSDNSFWVHRSDFLKLKNIQLGYLLPGSISSKIKIKKLYLYANAQNVFTLLMYKGYEGFDPERVSDGGGASIYPVARVFSLGINLTF